MLYAVEAGGAIKIGFARTSARARIAELQTGNAHELRLLAECAGELPYEKWLHKMLQAHRIRGEWFRPAELVLEFVEAMKNGIDNDYEHIHLEGTAHGASESGVGKDSVGEAASAGMGASEPKPTRSSARGGEGKTANRRDRKAYNAYQRELMRRRRAKSNRGHMRPRPVRCSSSTWTICCTFGSTAG